MITVDFRAYSDDAGTRASEARERPMTDPENGGADKYDKDTERNNSNAGANGGLIKRIRDPENNDLERISKL
jgi:hypothetical protein